MYVLSETFWRTVKTFLSLEKNWTYTWKESFKDLGEKEITWRSKGTARQGKQRNCMDDQRAKPQKRQTSWGAEDNSQRLNKPGIELKKKSGRSSKTQWVMHSRLKNFF